jgi:TetR/AcrR family transcriptional regulator
VTFIEVNARRPEMARLMNVEASVGGPRLDYLFERFVTPCLIPAVALSAKLQAEGRMRPVPVGTLFFLVTHGATAPAAHRPLAALLGITDPTDPAGVRVHARTVAELLIQPATCATEPCPSQPLRASSVRRRRRSSISPSGRPPERTLNDSQPW